MENQYVDQLSINVFLVGPASVKSTNRIFKGTGACHRDCHATWTRHRMPKAERFLLRATKRGGRPAFAAVIPSAN